MALSLGLAMYELRLEFAGTIGINRHARRTRLGAQRLTIDKKVVSTHSQGKPKNQHAVTAA